jgi:hypothetical protein
MSGIGAGMGRGWRPVVVRKAGRFSSEDIHDAIFPKPPRARTIAELKEGMRQHAREKHARR